MFFIQVFIVIVDLDFFCFCFKNVGNSKWNKDWILKIKKNLKKKTTQLEFSQNVISPTHIDYKFENNISSISAS